MKRTALAVALAFLILPQAYAAPWLKSVAAAQKKAKEKNQIIFVDLYADWCGWCHRMEQEVFPSQAFQNATDQMVLLRLNTEDGAEGSKLSQQFQVTSLPTFLMLAPDLTIAGIIRGYAPSTEFVKTMTETEAKYDEFQKRMRNEKSIAGDYQKRLDLARDLTARYALPQSEARLKSLAAEPKAPQSIRDQASYELAVSQLLQKHYAEALVTLNRYTKVPSKGETYERAKLLIGQVYLEQGNLMAAATEFRRFKTNFPNSSLVRNVDMVLPQIEQQLKQQ